ncbi:MAG: nucleoside-diphosphate sugar epimerase/dehydratase [bacterium]|jgi:FlaA1/EpsC-like NDP-sugar epimerase|nr:nucleoside-diphosphate sugar epimerase/dehydratase [bacterium]
MVPWNRRRWILWAIEVAVDVGLVALSGYLAFWIRFEKDLPPYIYHYKNSILIVLAFRIFFFHWFGLYKGLWRYATIQDLISIVKAVSVSSVAVVVTLYFRQHLGGFPRSIFIIDWLLTLVFIGGFRFLIRILREFKRRRSKGGKRVLVVGAGDAGEKMVREMLKDQNLGYNPVGFIDDDLTKQNLTIHGIRVLGGRKDIPACLKRFTIDEVLIAIPSASSKDVRGIMDHCRESGVKVKTLPPLSELFNGTVSLNRIRDVDLRDLLGRDELKLFNDEIMEQISGKRILISGAGGSIGAELARQLAPFSPKSLVFLGQGENSIYLITKEFETTCPELPVEPVIADIRDREKLNRVFQQYRPDIVFHAAAFKHVPLMEFNGDQAVRNNIFGSRNLMELSSEFGVKEFVMISTDKAVNPTSIMGVTKRVAELIMQNIATQSKTKFVAVRFGNVLGSRGSVIPLFRQQIARGGPVTVTHPQVTRYFMTTTEASQLVIQAALLGKSGEIMVLDMGEPVKIAELAKDLIVLSGLRPDMDIKIEFTGLRAGEKLFEELLTKEEGMTATKHRKIFVASPDKIDSRDLNRKLKRLEHALLKMTDAELVESLKTMVPAYQPNRNNVVVALDGSSRFRLYDTTAGSKG